MTNPLYLRSGLFFSAIKANEEAGEFIQAICKALNYGWWSVDPTLPDDVYHEPNVDWVLRELEDLQGRLEALHAEIIRFKGELH